MNIEYKGYTFIYIIYRCWPMSYLICYCSIIHISIDYTKRERVTLTSKEVLRDHLASATGTMLSHLLLLLLYLLID